MRVVTLAAYLDRAQRTEIPAAHPAAMAAPAMTRTEEVEAARRLGDAEGREAARLDHAAELEREVEKFDARLSAARQAWITEQSEALSRQIGEGLTRIETTITDAAARLLEPLLVAGAREAALAGLKETLEDLLEKSPAVTMRIGGPDDLLAALRERLGERKSIAYVPGTGTDIQIETGDTLIETRLAAWAAHLREAKT